MVLVVERRLVVVAEVDLVDNIAVVVDVDNIVVVLDLVGSIAVVVEGSLFVAVVDNGLVLVVEHLDVGTVIKDKC